MRKSILVAAAAVLVLAACPVIDTVGYGSLILGFSSADMQTRTIVPEDFSMAISNYIASGVGPGGATFGPLNVEPGNSIVRSSLVTGTWTITADAFNGTATQVGTGSVVVPILAGQTESASVYVRPLTGTGTLEVAVNWPPFDHPVLAVTVTDAGGTTHPATSSTPITEVDGTAMATYTWDAIGAGYYWLNVRLSDGAEVNWGARPAVRIVTGQTTEAAFTLDTIDLGTQETGGMEVSIVEEMRNPVTISLWDNAQNPPTGAELVSPLTITEGNSINVSVSNPSSAEFYQWYVDGTLVDEGEISSTLVYGNSLTPGRYRVDVGIRTETGLVLSSKNFNIEVTAP